jgi:DNA replication protein DnaC
MALSSSLSAAPECPVCAGTGWKTVAVPGKSSRVTRCDCRIDSRAERLLKLANIPSRYEHCTLQNFEIDFPQATHSLSEARLLSQDFVRDYPLEKLGLLLIGPVGVGKTHLGVGIIQGLIRLKGCQCLFCDYRELLKQIQNSYNPQVQATELQILQPVFDAEVLLLDELGAVKPTEWVWDTVSFLLNSRYNEKKTTIITTNFADYPSRKTVQAGQKAQRKSQQEEEIEAAAKEESLGDRITDRMWSRLHEMCRVVTLKGKDFRTLSHNWQR